MGSLSLFYLFLFIHLANELLTLEEKDMIMESSSSRNKVYKQVTKIPQEGKGYQQTEKEETNFCLREPGRNCGDGFF